MQKQTFSQKPNIKINQKINSNIINAIKILQMSSSEIDEFTRKEIEKNPFLLPSKKPYYSDENSNIDNQAKKNNIKEWLYQQSSLIASNNSEEKLIEIYIENLDNFGFCKITSNEAAELSNTSEVLSSKILLKLKSLDPLGIFSNSISEHLSFQLLKKGVLDSKYEILIKNLKYVASGNLNKLAELCEVNIAKIITMIKNIKSLKPRPLEELEATNIEIVFPDILVKTDNTKIKISLYNDNYYQVIINEKYVNQMKVKQKNLPNIEMKKYIQDCITHGKMLQNNLNRRNETILLVAKTVLEFQKAFFSHGEESILPLTHKDISIKILMNESTVSRAVKNKYVKCNSKIIPLSYFFNSKITNKLNIDNSSSISIKSKIKRLIGSEKQLGVIFSDQKIVNFLKKESIIISRRTITKYRESLKIPSSFIRSKKN
tara:strand:+ start:2951 stop:4243 length:1293 start_codon:yes stop_codon:yes gene_type:complete